MEMRKKNIRRIVAAAIFVVATVAATNIFAQSKIVRLTRFKGEKLTGVKISAPFMVELSQGDNTSAVVEISEELEKDLVFENRNGVVYIDVKSNKSKNGNLDLFSFFSSDDSRKRFENKHLVARITVKDLCLLNLSVGASVYAKTPFGVDNSAIELSSASSVNGMTLKGNNIKLDVSSASSFNAASVSCDEFNADLSSAANVSIDKLEAEEVELDASSSASAVVGMTAQKSELSTSSAGHITASGRCDSCQIKGSSGSKISARGLDANVVDASFSSGASGEITVRKSLAVLVSSGGKLTYNGSPDITSRGVYSGGSLVQGFAK